MLIGLIGIAMFSLTLPFTKIAVQSLSPWFVAFGRATLAGCCAVVLLWVTRAQWPSLDQFKKLVVVSLGVVYGFPIFTSIAMQHLPSGHSGIVLGILPLATSVVAALRFKERPSLAYWWVAVLGSALVVCYATFDNSGSLTLDDVWLLLAIVSAAVGYCEGGVLSKEMGAIPVISWALVMTLPINGVVTVFILPPTLLEIPWPALISFTYVGLFSMFIGFFFWYKGIAMGGMARVSQVQLIQPFLTLLGAYVLLSEPITALNVLFALAVLVVVVLGRKTKIAQAQ